MKKITLIEKYMSKITNIFSEISPENYWDSILITKAKEHSNNPIYLLYLINLITKQYTLFRSEQLLGYKGDYPFPAPEITTWSIPDIKTNYIFRKHIINLESSSLIPSAWKASKLIDTIKYVGTNDNPWQFNPGFSLHGVEFIFPLCITRVHSNGNHSITTGILKHCSACMSNDSYADISESYQHIKYENGIFSTPSGSFRVHPHERVLGVLYEIGRYIKNSGFTYDDYVNKYQANYNPATLKDIADVDIEHFKYNSTKLVNEIIGQDKNDL
jgi:hypothetical protein